MTGLSHCYIAGFGLISSIGGDAEMNYASYKAGINRYQLSEYRSKEFKSLRQARVPEAALDDLSSNLALGSLTSPRYSRIILMAQQALSQLFLTTDHMPDISIPLFQSGPEALLKTDNEFNHNLALNIVKQAKLVNNRNNRVFDTGRAAVTEAIELAFRAFEVNHADFILVGGSDSFDDPAIINIYDQQNRLLHEDATGGFTPGDGAGYILLTPHKHFAMQREKKHICISKPSIDFEPGHLFSNAPYLGEGLANCFTNLFSLSPQAQVDKIYSSMNGESYWAKEYGVARIRNSEHFTEHCELEHPADCYGDLGSATGAALIILAALELWKAESNYSSLVYCSSDKGLRAAHLMGVEQAQD